MSCLVSRTSLGYGNHRGSSVGQRPSGLLDWGLQRAAGGVDRGGNLQPWTAARMDIRRDCGGWGPPISGSSVCQGLFNDVLLLLNNGSDPCAAGGGWVDRGELAREVGSRPSGSGLDPLHRDRAG